MLSLKQVLLEMGGISGIGVRAKDGPLSGKLDPKDDELRDALTTEVPARVSPSHHQMSSRPTAPQGLPVRGTMDPDAERQALAAPGSTFLPPGETPEDYDTPPEDLRKPVQMPNFPAKAGPGMSRQRASRQEFDPSRMLSPAELAQAKKQLGLESKLPSLKSVLIKK